MYALARPILFTLPPHAAHGLAALSLAPLEAFGLLRSIARPKLSPALRTTALGLEMPSIVGLAGGFDKNATRPKALASLGFGFLELGTVTALPQEENPRPNLFRIPNDRALINRLGFPNEGARAVAARVAKKRAHIAIPIGMSIGKSRAVALDPIEGAIEDYLSSFRAVRNVSDFVVVNVSSPNTKDLRAMQGAEIARLLLSSLVKEAGELPILVKIAPDLSNEDLEGLLAVVEETNVAGIVATNTTISRSGLSTNVESIGAGGLSGPPLRARALEVVRRARDRLKKITIIGVGGIETGEDAIAFLRAGADLLQIYTAFIYRGPYAAAWIAREALDIAKREGAERLSDLVRH